MGTLHLKKGHVQPLWAGHPWVFRQAIHRVDGAPGPGDPVRVLDPEGKFLGAGFYSPKSAIPVRLLTRDPEEELDSGAIARRLDRALQFRHRLGLPSETTTAFRWIHAEGDSLPGLIVDVFGDVAVVQIGTIGMKNREEAIFGLVSRIGGVKAVVAAAGDHSRGEDFVSEWRTVRGDDPESLQFKERGFEIELPAALTQKTGYYLDQRPNRHRIEAIAHGLGGGRLLDAYSYLGTTSLAALRGGMDRAVCIDRSALAVAAGAQIAGHAGYGGDRIEFDKEDAKKALPRLHQRGEKFDVVIVDPPKLAPTRQHLERARRAYLKINENALRLVERDGVLMTCSCSAAMRDSELVRVVAKAASRVGREVVLFDRGGAGADHPTPAGFPEGRYLKALFFRVG